METSLTKQNLEKVEVVLEKLGSHEIQMASGLDSKPYHKNLGTDRNADLYQRIELFMESEISLIPK